MSLSKGIRHCRRCTSTKGSLNLGRFQHSGSSNTINTSKMTSKMLTINQWKMLVHLKEYLVKLNDKKLHDIFNKQTVKFLQRLQPAVYGKDSLKMFDRATSETTEVVETKAEDKAESGYAFPNVFNGLKNKISGSKDSELKDVAPKWKNSVPAISKASLNARTKYVLLSLATAESCQSKLNRVEGLLQHLKEFPAVKSQIVKEGGVRLLLRIRQQSTNLDVHAAVNEALSLIGYCDPIPGHGVRILSIDGGGIRGLLVIEMLKKLEELTGKRVHEMFDFICGVSTGAIITCSIGVRQTSMTELAQHYREMSAQVFKQSPLWGTGNLVWSHSYYDTTLFENVLKEYFGDTELITCARNPSCPKLAAISAVVNQSHVTAYVFRNYSLPWRVQSQYMGGYNHKVWEAIRASAAAPTYFEECKLGNLLHQDGGILVNNPTAVAIHEAKQLWPNSSIQCVVSFGTGRTVPSHPESIPEQQTNSSSSWRTKFMKILDSATDTEGVHTMLNDLLPPNVYFRFNPYLTEMLNMVETEPSKLEQLERDAIMYLRRNEDKFQEAAKVLNETKGPAQKAIDWMNLKREIVGFSLK